MENVVYAGMLGPWQIGLIVLAILLLFGGKKLPELMKGMGKGIKGFKDEMNGPADSNGSTSKAGDNTPSETKSEE
jgi:sec-independent protein translocase protein TatA